MIIICLQLSSDSDSKFDIYTDELSEEEMTDASSKADKFEDDDSSDEDSNGEDAADKLVSVPLPGEIIRF